MQRVDKRHDRERCDKHRQQRIQHVQLLDKRHDP